MLAEQTPRGNGLAAGRGLPEPGRPPGAETPWWVEQRCLFGRQRGPATLVEMNRLLLAPLLIVLAACAPSQTVKPILYQASSADLLTAVQNACPQVLLNGLYDSFKVISTNSTSVTCTTQPIASFQVLLGSKSVTMTFTAAPAGASSAVTGVLQRDEVHDNDRDPVGAVFALLDQQFRRVP